jgi:hypothetical protein
LRRQVTDVALLAYIARKKADVVSYTEAVKACKSSSSASRALHQLIHEGLIEPKPKLLGLRYVTQYVITQRGKQASALALQLSELREISKAASARVETKVKSESDVSEEEPQVRNPPKKASVRQKEKKKSSEA